MFEISASSTSVGIDITTGPGIPSLATLNALEIIFGKSSGSLISSTNFVISANVLVKSISCKCIFPKFFLLT